MFVKYPCHEIWLASYLCLNLFQLFQLDDSGASGSKPDNGFQEAIQPRILDNMLATFWQVTPGKKKNNRSAINMTNA